MIKHLIICSSVFLGLLFNSPGYADEHFPFLAEVSKESVNVRSGPNTNFEKLTELNKGAQVVVVGRNYEWLKVQPMESIKSYIRSDYLKAQDDTDLAEVVGDSVNVRTKPTSDSDSLGQVKRGTMVKVIAQVNGWSQVSAVAGTIVWIHQDFLKKVSDDVPGSLLIPTTPTAQSANSQPPPPVPAKEGVSPWVSMRGTIEVLVKPLGPDIHYEIVMDDKSTFLLQDIPQMAYFCNTVVNIEGAIVPDPKKQYLYPLLHINKITLVL